MIMKIKIKFIYKFFLIKIKIFIYLNKINNALSNYKLSVITVESSVNGGNSWQSKSINSC
jgi:hypothetical protein